MSKLLNLIEKPELLNQIKLYEDEHCVAVLSRKPASLCHVILFPRNKAVIFEQVPDPVAAHLFIVANKISRAMFESLNIQGTNIYVENGVAAGQEDPQFCMHIIARTENDGITLDWEPRQLSEEEMSTIELQYKQFTENIEPEPAASSPGADAGDEDDDDDDDTEDEDNYLLKYYRRYP